MRLLLVVGARPNFVKLAPFARILKSTPSLPFKIVHTGQHYDYLMSKAFFDELLIPPPDFNLEVGSGSLAHQIGHTMLKFEQVCRDEKPDLVVVFGDVNATAACSLAAVHLQFKVAHVEAGLRSFDRTMPEEINRIVTDSLSALLFTPSADADENLLKEGHSREEIRLVGNIMIDTLVAFEEQWTAVSTLRDLGLEGGRYAYVTIHRPQNVDTREALSAIVSELNALAKVLPVILPLHPRTRRNLEQWGFLAALGTGVRCLDPLGYFHSLNLAKHARLIITDSGGLQEEATFFRTPCLTLRPNTERPITIHKGSNRLTVIERLMRDVEQALAGPERIGTIPDYWDGHTAERIVTELLNEKV